AFSVEVAGLEPASFSPLMELLRAQPVRCLGPFSSTGTGEGPQSAFGVPSGPPTEPFRGAPLDDAPVRPAGLRPGERRYLLGSECKLVGVGFCFCFRL